MVREFVQTHAFAPAFFSLCILIATFTILNLFIAVIVDAMHRLHQREETPDQKTLRRIEESLADMRQAMKRARPSYPIRRPSLTPAQK